MKNLIFFVSIFLFSINTNSQNIQKPQHRISCSPISGARFILIKPDTNAIHPSWLENYVGGGTLGKSWSFEVKKIITNEKGVFLYGDVISPRGGKMNVSQNGYSGYVYTYQKEWQCDVLK